MPLQNHWKIHLQSTGAAISDVMRSEQQTFNISEFERLEVITLKSKILDFRLEISISKG